MRSSLFCALQAASSKPQQNGCQHSTPDTHLHTTASKGGSTKGKKPTMLVTDSQAATRRLPRLRRATHTNSDTQAKKSEGLGQQAGPSQKAGTSTSQQQQQHQQRALQQPIKAQGSQHALDPPAAEGVHLKPHSKQRVRTALTALTAGKGKSKGARLPGTDTEEKAAGSKQVAGAVKKGKKAAGSKGQLKGLPAHSVSEGKSPIGTKQWATAVTQSSDHEGKPTLDAKEEPAASPVQGETHAHNEQLSPDASDLPFGLGKGKRKRTATKPLHMEEESKVAEQAGSRQQDVGGKLKEEQVCRYAHMVACTPSYADAGESVSDADWGRKRKSLGGKACFVAVLGFLDWATAAEPDAVKYSLRVMLRA